MGSRWTPSGANEVGIDGYIELFEPASRVSLGLTLAVQSKVVSSIRDAAEEFRYSCDSSDLEYWLKGKRSFTRLYREGTYPPLRGSFLKLETDTGLLYLRGSYSSLKLIRACMSRGLWNFR